MNETSLTALLLTLRYASLATLIVFVPGMLIAYALARYSFPGKVFVSALTSLPLVLPPTAVGYLLLRLFATDGPLGRETLGFDPNILLTGKAVVVACAVMSAPLVIRTSRVAFEGVNTRYESMARTLGYGPVETFWRFTFPLAARGLLAALILGFTRAMGEFGVTVTIAGNIPGRTQTLPSAIFSAQQVGKDHEANFLVLVALATGLCAIFAAEFLSTRGSRSGSS
ncbi:MAG: molybdate ABC transporter permease subunit [Thiogranum sp.]